MRALCLILALLFVPIAWSSPYPDTPAQTIEQREKSNEERIERLERITVELGKRADSLEAKLLELTKEHLQEEADK